MSFILNIPTPYRFPVYDRVSKATTLSLKLFTEFDRKMNKQHLIIILSFYHQVMEKYHTNFLNLFNS